LAHNGLLFISSNISKKYSLQFALKGIISPTPLCQLEKYGEYLGWSEDSHKLTKVQRGYTHFSVTDMKGLVDTIDRVFEPILKRGVEK
jgi:hypothetical protein